MAIKVVAETTLQAVSSKYIKRKYVSDNIRVPKLVPDE